MDLSPASLVSAALRHPLSLAVKGRIKEVIWEVRGLAISNPPLPKRVDTLLFVCKGNICRSPFAAELARIRLPADLSIASAGFAASVTSQAPLPAVTAGRRYGLSLDRHVPRLLTPDLMAGADMVLVMEAYQQSLLRELYPAHADRVFLLPLFEPSAADGRYEQFNITDPYGRGADAFDRAYRRIDANLTTLGRAFDRRSMTTGL